MAFSVSRFLPRDGINFLQERKKERKKWNFSIDLEAKFVPETGRSNGREIIPTVLPQPR